MGAYSPTIGREEPKFFASPANLKLDQQARTVQISQIFEWFGTDFAAAPAGQLEAVRKYFPQPEAAAWVSDPAVKVKYLEYDWLLNDQEPVCK